MTKDATSYDSMRDPQGRPRYTGIPTFFRAPRRRSRSPRPRSA